MASPRREERQRAATLILRYRQRYGTRAIARILGIPKSTVHDWIVQGPEGVRNPRLRIITKKAHDGLVLTAAEEQEAGLEDFIYADDVEVAGVAVLAADTGRLLMLQRSNADESDPAAGTWEFPGGHLEGDELPFDGAMREWGEETGADLPEGDHMGMWTSPDGRYRGFVHQIPSEAALDINLDHEDRAVLNPDDPDGDDIEVAAWWDPAHLPMPGMRQEVAEQWPAIQAVLRGTPAFHAAEAQQTGVMVAFMLPPDVAEQLALEPGSIAGEIQPPDELHLTLAFLGSADQVGDQERLRRTVAAFAAGAAPVKGTISGVGRFSDGDKAMYASFDAPTLPEWRQALIGHLKAAGYQPSERHGYTPHITLALETVAYTTVDVPTLEVAFDQVTIAIAGVRSAYPLGVRAAEPMQPERDPNIDRPRKPVQEPVERPPEQGEHVKQGDLPELGPGEPSTALEGTNVPRETPPPLLDKLYVLAMHRWVNLIANDVPHYAAVHAAQQIDPDFEIAPEHMYRAYHALGKGDQPVKLADPLNFATNWGAGQVKPPEYVQSVYDEFEYAESHIAELANYLFDLAKGSYMEGINEQLIRLGQPIRTAVTDEEILAEVRTETRRIAEGIANTYNRDLGGRVYSEWLQLVATRGRMSSRYWLQTAIDQWARARATWKSDQIAITEVGRWWAKGSLAFANRNAGRLMVKRAWCSPDECVCDACTSLVLGNPYTLADANTVNLPLHASCVHDWVYDWEVLQAGDDLAGLWAAGEDPADIEFEVAG